MNVLNVVKKKKTGKVPIGGVRRGLLRDGDEVRAFPRLPRDLDIHQGVKKALIRIINARDIQKGEFPHHSRNAPMRVHENLVLLSLIGDHRARRKGNGFSYKSSSIMLDEFLVDDARRKIIGFRHLPLLP